MSGNASVTYRSNPLAKQQAMEAIFKGVEDVFQLDIVPRAKVLSPVRKIKSKVKIKGQWVPGGTNKRSIDYLIEWRGNTIFAQIFTQSGYGGYLELGTVHMTARPYLFPAFDENKAKIMSYVGQRIYAIEGRK